MKFALCVLTFLTLGLGAVRAADAPPAPLAPWHILPAESRLTFTAHDIEGKPLSGSFGRFTGRILFDPARLPESQIKIDVDMPSASADAPEAQDDLSKPEWLGAQAFPAAHYASTAITKRADGQYQADGTLTLKGVTLPVTLLFRLPSYGPKPGVPGTLRAVARGTAQLSRGAFKIGQSDAVADPVDLSFTITAEQP